MGTSATPFRGHLHYLVGFGFGKPFPARTFVSGFGPFGFALAGLMALNGNLRRGSRGTEESLLPFALLIAEFLPQAFIFFQKLIDFALLSKQPGQYLWPAIRTVSSLERTALGFPGDAWNGLGLLDSGG
jgi:hypothetical protein